MSSPTLRSDLPPQLADLISQYDACSKRAIAVADGLTPERLTRRPAPESWSIAECFVHLTLSHAPFPALLTAAFAEARDAGQTGTGPFKADLRGRLVKWGLEPPPRIKLKAKAPFQPVKIDSPERVLPDFLDLQGRLEDCIRAAAGLRIDRVKIVSPVDSRVKYNVFAALQIIAAHERRHLWQAERVRASG
jgi:hypothetical protein